MTAMPPRAIRLRRPPTLSVQEGVFVPNGDAGLLDEIERRWNELRQGNSAYFDGRLCHVIGVHRNGHGGATLHVIDCAYRFFAVQREDFDLGVHPLGVKGVIERDGRFLMGRRSPRVAMYQNVWEFAPSGSVDFGKEPAAVIAHELVEETGIHALGEPVAIAVLFDPVLKCWEIVYRLSIDADASPKVTNEYPEIAWFDRESLPDDLSPIAQQIAEFVT
jgi:8-oxo-dGTP pyrophosphatase MutT (NUDIX family)